MATFAFDFEPRWQRFLAIFGVAPGKAWVEVDEAGLQVRFGHVRVHTPLTNVSGAEITGPYRWYKVLGPRMSLVDKGATLGSSTRAGVCITFHRPIRAPGLLGFLRHPGLTVTVAEPAALLNVLRSRAPSLRTAAPGSS